jgi:triosephosphate isomerase
MGRRPALTLGVSLKLYLDIPHTVRWAQAVAAIAARHAAVRAGDVRLFALPSLPALEGTREALAGSGVGVGAQDLFWEDRGPYTGGVSGADLRRAGCTFVEIGHAERRSVFGEGDEIVRRKFAAAVRNGLVPVLCVGEGGSVENAADDCVAQFQAAMHGLSDDATVDELIVAYEPVWAIGAEHPAPADHVATVAGTLRDAVARDGRVADASVIYGGSAQPGVLAELDGTVDGLFLGRFAHDPKDFERVIDEAAALL